MTRDHLKLPPPGFRKYSLEKRREWLGEQYGENNEDFASSGRDKDLLVMADMMVENAAGYMPLPLGLAYPLLIDGRKYAVPMATEEPSVIAAASYAGFLTARHGGFSTQASPPVMGVQIFLEKVEEKTGERVKENQESLKAALEDLLASMKKRGGGWRGMDCQWLPSSGSLKITVDMDVQDAMGANLLNSAGERLRPVLERLTGGKVLMSILSNRSWQRRGKAWFRVPAAALGRPGFPGEETARRLVRAAAIAREDPDRGVTHNKGIMNGVTALALAAGSDTRAIEAAAHSWAGREGGCLPFSRFWLEENNLCGELEMPLPMGTTGGAVDYHPVSRWTLDVLGHPGAPGLSRIAAALGLAQNLAALRSLVSEGIQKGHMSLQARRLAWAAGAGKDELSPFAAFLQEEGVRSRQSASRRLEIWRKERLSHE